MRLKHVHVFRNVSPGKGHRGRTIRMAKIAVATSAIKREGSLGEASTEGRYV
jgi:hypothetical protein